MRFDEIDVKGEFKIRGKTGSENQFMVLVGNSLEWLDPAPEVTGFDVYGKNYIFCFSLTYSATASGENLRNTYASASTLVGLSQNNRAAILINPGVYDFDTEPLGLSLSYVDLVGISSAASSVTLQSSNSLYTLKYYEGVDSGLYNIGVGPIMGSSSTYVRLDNIDLKGSMTNFDNLLGEFRNIKVYSGALFGYAEDSVNGIFENIDFLGNCSGAFIVNNQNIVGTFSNLNFDTLSGTTFATNGDISIDLDGLKVRDGSGVQFFLSENITGKFKNIDVYNLGEFFTSQNVIYCTLNNIKFVSQNISSFLNSSNSDLFVEASDLYVDLQGRFCTTLVGQIIGTFSNIKVNNCETAFISDQLLSGDFSKMDFGYVETGEVFVSNNGNIVASFNDITFDEIGGVTSDPNIISGDIIQVNVNNFSINKSILPITGTIFSGSEISGNFRNINIGTCSNLDVFRATLTLDGNFSNIVVKESNNLFIVNSNVSGGFLSGGFDNVISENVNNNAFSTIGDVSLFGTYSNIELKNVTGRAFTTDGGSILSGDFYNIKLGNVDSTFVNTSGDVDINVRNLKVVKTSGIFKSLTNLFGKLSNVTVGESGPDGFFYSEGVMDLVVNDFKIMSTNGVPGEAFSSLSSISGTYSNIYIRSNEVGVNYFQSSLISGYYENIFLGSASSCFNGDASGSTRIKNLNVSSPFSNGVGGFGGRITDSYINAIGTGLASIKIKDQLDGNVPTIERCRLLSDIISITSPVNPTNASITYLITNSPMSPSVVNNITNNKNIISSFVKTESKI